MFNLWGVRLWVDFMGLKVEGAGGSGAPFECVHTLVVFVFLRSLFTRGLWALRI